jgi:hypothetical protein
MSMSTGNKITMPLHSRAIEPTAIYTVREAAALASLAPKTMQRKIASGVINASRRLGTWRVRGSELLKTA